MRKLKFLVLLILHHTVGYSQFGEQQIIDGNASAPFTIVAIDLDGDDDIDVVTAAYGDNEITWHENLDGQGAFSTANPMPTQLQNSRFVALTDIDNDGDIDIVGTSQSDNLVVWYENLDGQGSFSSQHTINNDAISPREIVAADFDGDDDIDVVTANRTGGSITWNKNIEGTGNFGPTLFISNTISEPISIVARDLDNDNDLDIIASSAGNQQFVWFENLDGLGTFGGAQIISTNSSGITSVFAADIDGDGDIDVLSALGGSDIIDWFENIDGQGTFGPQQIISNSIEVAIKVYATDLDGDTDIDVLAAALAGDRIVWFENLDGLGSFSNEQIISSDTDNPTSVFAADLDGDGLKDVLSTSIADSKVAWYKNEILSIKDHPFQKVNVYPNPVKNQIHIDSKGIHYDSAIVTDLLGNLILMENEQKEILDVSLLKSGMYFLTLVFEDISDTIKFIKY